MFHLLGMAARVLPRSVRRPARDVLDRLGDGWARVLGRPVPLEPPAGLVTGIGGSWWVGENYLRHFRDLCGLQPHEAVLDVGCGVGRMAVPLTGYLSRAARASSPTKMHLSTLRVRPGDAMRFNLRLKGRTADGRKCQADVSVYASTKKQLMKQADEAARSAAWLSVIPPYDPIPEGSHITVEHVEKI